MDKLLLFLGTIMALYGRCQSNECASATILNLGATCQYTNGTTSGADESLNACSGNADDDVWYQFTASTASCQISVTGSASFDPVVQLFSGSCSNLNSLTCKNNSGNGGTETIIQQNLVIGWTYKVRIYHYGSGSGSGDFSICITSPVLPPPNDACLNAININSQSTCVFSSQTNQGASQSLTACSGNADDDVWFTFTATNAVHIITAIPVSSIDLVIQTFSGTCSNLNSIECHDATFSGQAEQVTLLGLTPGQSYYFRIYDYNQGNFGTFQLCVSGSTSSLPTNDGACQAILLPEITASCNYLQFSTTGATASTTAPLPANCAGGVSPQQGGFTSSSKDIWFKILVPSSGNLHIVSEPNLGTGSISDGVMALYSGSCSSLTQIACSDDTPSYPGSLNDLLPLISVNGLIPNSYVYLRYFGYGINAGNFGFCVSTATNDNCSNALYICDLNGYSASTSGAFTPDRPSNMRGNNEDVNGNNLPDGNNSGGIFGQAGPWGVGSPFYDVTINNNSWIRFTAANTSASLNVSISDCWIGNYPFGGIQMQIFEATNCSNFVPVSDFMENSTGFTITANNLVVGNSYFLMVDGYAGDICNYTISAVSGIQFPELDPIAPICAGESVLLTAPSGATSYLWQPNGSTAQSILITPENSQNFSCEVTGLCNHKQIIETFITVNPLPELTSTPILTNSACNLSTGSIDNLNFSGGTVFNYIWTDSTGGVIANTPEISAIAAGTYFVEVGNDMFCTQSYGPFNVNNYEAPANPEISLSDSSFCEGSQLNLSVQNYTPNSTYTWYGPNGFTSQNYSWELNDLQPNQSGNYCLYASYENCMSDTVCQSITVLEATNVQIITEDDTPCIGDTLSICADGASEYLWSTNVFLSNLACLEQNISTPEQSGYYNLHWIDANGCEGLDSFLLAVNVPISPTIISNQNDSIICLSETIQLSVNNIVNINWTDPNGQQSNQLMFIIPEAQETNEGWYFVSGLDTNGCIVADSIYLGIIQASQDPISPDELYLCPGDELILNSEAASVIQWSGPNLYTSNNAFVSISSVNSSQSGWYILEASDTNGCFLVDSVLVIIEPNRNCLLIPNLVTPDGNNLNDHWEINGIESFPNNQVEIFNRWGNIIYSSSPYMNEWKGQVNRGFPETDEGEKVPIGTYFYILTLDKNQTETFSGFIDVQY